FDSLVFRFNRITGSPPSVTPGCCLTCTPPSQAMAEFNITPWGFSRCTILNASTPLCATATSKPSCFSPAFNAEIKLCPTPIIRILATQHPALPGSYTQHPDNPVPCKGGLRYFL